MIQVDGFKKALSRGGGASRFLRFLSRKKDGAAASADTITLDDMLIFSPVRILLTCVCLWVLCLACSMSGKHAPLSHRIEAEPRHCECLHATQNMCC